MLALHVFTSASHAHNLSTQVHVYMSICGYLRPQGATITPYSTAAVSEIGPDIEAGPLR